MIKTTTRKLQDSSKEDSSGWINVTPHRWLSWLSIGLSRGRSWVRLRSDQHTDQHSSTLRRKCCLCNYISKWLHFQAFSDKYYKLEVPSHNPCCNNCGMLQHPHTIRKRVGHGVPDVVVWLHSFCSGGTCEFFWLDLDCELRHHAVWQKVPHKVL